MERDTGKEGIGGELLDLCWEAVKTLPNDVREYLIERFRRRGFGNDSRGIDAALEIYRYAFFGEKPPRRYRSLIRPIIVALQLSGEDK
jgi:hypothetical protein